MHHLNLKGLVGFGLIPSDFRESTGDTLGGIGSAIDLKHGSFGRTGSDGSFKGTFIMLPDRGFNMYVSFSFFCEVLMYFQ